MKTKTKQNKKKKKEMKNEKSFNVKSKRIFNQLTTLVTNVQRNDTHTLRIFFLFSFGLGYSVLLAEG